MQKRRAAARFIEKRRVLDRARKSTRQLSAHCDSVARKGRHDSPRSLFFPFDTLSPLEILTFSPLSCRSQKVVPYLVETPVYHVRRCLILFS